MRILFGLAFLILISHNQSRAQFYYGTQTDFGKNRVQYKDEFWSYFKFDRYDTYFYQGGKPLAVFTSKVATRNIEELEKFFDYSLEGKVDFIIYNKLADFRQSNIGITQDAQNNVGGKSTIVGNKVFLYFEGSYTDLEKQIRGGLTEIIVYQMMFGGDWKDKVKNSTLLNLPEWYVKGLVSYMSEKWSVNIDSKVKDAVHNGKFEKFSRLTGDDATIAGHAMWHYVTEIYGQSVISNIVYMTKISRNVDSGFLFVIGSSLKNTLAPWQEYYEKKYQGENSAKLPEEGQRIKVHKNYHYSNLRISPDGSQAIYVTNQMGQTKVWMQNMETGKRKRLFKQGQKLDRVNDLSYPLLGWHPTGKAFSMINEKRGKLFLNIYDMEEKRFEEKELFNMEKILDFNYSPDGKKLTISAIQNGQSDVFVYTIASNSLEPVTKDQYTDRHPVFLSDGRNIVFSSDRENDTLKVNEELKGKPQSNMDLFMYDYQLKSKTLKRVTNTPDISESSPMRYDSKHFAFNSDESGIVNRHLAFFDSAIAYIDTAAHYKYFTSHFPITDYPRNIIEHDFQPTGSRFTEIVYLNGTHELWVRNMVPAPSAKVKNPFETAYREEISRKYQISNDQNYKVPQDTSKIIDESVPKQEKQVDINNYKFDFEVSPRVNTTESDLISKAPKDTVKIDTSSLKETPLIIPKQRNYNLKFYKDLVINQVDNSQMNATYQLFNGGPYINPGLSAVVKVGITDLFENYRIYGGIRFGGSNSREYFLAMDDFKLRWDKHYEISRQETRYNYSNGVQINVHSHFLKYGLTYPFSEVSSIRGMVSMRNDRIIPLSTDLKNLQLPIAMENWGSLKLQYVFDNTLSKGLNLYTGTRLKLFAETYNQIETIENNLNIVGLDIRNYLKIHKEFIWANRIAASSSFGSRKLIYYMGGVDNWLVTRDRGIFSYDTPIDFSQNYQYQALATNMRGFLQNTRNGNNFVVINSELRLPIFRYLISRPIRSDFIYNFQIIGFADVGTAWTGITPYSNKNYINTKTIYHEPLLITLDTHKEPVVGGFGYGFRFRLFGYFVRMDYAWGVEDGDVNRDRMFYLSLATDF